jgi:hypothetical protein
MQQHHLTEEEEADGKSTDCHKYYEGSAAFSHRYPLYQSVFGWYVFFNFDFARCRSRAS